MLDKVCGHRRAGSAAGGLARARCVDTVAERASAVYRRGMTQLLRGRAALIGVVALLGACGGARSSRPAAPAARTILEVDNRSFVDMTVYIVNGGQRVRVGLAVGKTVSQMTIPARVLGSARDLQFLADPIGSDRTAVSDQLFVRAGDRVTLVIPP